MTKLILEQKINNIVIVGDAFARPILDSLNEAKDMKIAAQPGWVWSKDIKPLVGTESCQAKHLGVIVEGTITCRHDDGSEITYSAGDAYSIEPGHDAWVVGNTKAVAYEFHGLWGEAG